MTSGNGTLLLPLLHAGHTALRVTTLDLRVTTLAAALFLAAAAWIWRPYLERPAQRLLRRRHRRAFARAVLTVLVFLAVLPSILPYDHLLPGQAHADDGEQEVVHASHCHVSPATCSDAPVTAGPGQLVLSQPLLATPSLLAVLLITAAPLLIGITVRPEVRPPLRPLAA